MAQQTPRSLGETITLGGIPYRLTSFEFYGDIIAYNAVRQDSWILDTMLIREFYPHNKAVLREKDGTLYLPNPKSDIVQQGRLLFLSILQAEQDNFRLLPTEIAAKTELFFAYGTWYLVQTIPKAITLDSILSNGAITLQAAIPLMIQLIDCVSQVHKHGMLHLSILPSQVYLFSSKQLFLSDVTLWKKNTSSLDQLFVKDIHYSAPEVRLRNFHQVCYSSDLYSCCAVFFHMLFGRPILEMEIYNFDLVRKRIATWCSYHDASPTLFYDLIHLFYRGLHILPRNRFNNTSELQTSLKILSQQISNIKE